MAHVNVSALYWSLGVTEINKEECANLFGIGTDGSFSNVTDAGLKWLVEEVLGCGVWLTD